MSNEEDLEASKFIPLVAGPVKTPLYSSTQCLPVLLSTCGLPFGAGEINCVIT